MWCLVAHWYPFAPPRCRNISDHNCAELYSPLSVSKWNDYLIMCLRAAFFLFFQYFPIHIILSMGSLVSYLGVGSSMGWLFWCIWFSNKLLPPFCYQHLLMIILTHYNH